MKKYKVGILGATGMVGQRFLTLLSNHPWFEVTIVAASAHSANLTYEESVENRWHMQEKMPEKIKNKIILDVIKDIKKIIEQVDFVFCAIDIEKEALKELEESYARYECPVISNNSAHRQTPDVPMIIPEINAEHTAVIKYQRKRLGTKKGFIAVKSNCSLQSYLPAIHPLCDFRINKVLVCTYQAISGAGKTLDTYPEIYNNVIPFIAGEEEKSEIEPLKIWGHVGNDSIINATKPLISTQCMRVPVENGHMASVFVKFDEKPARNRMIERWNNFLGRPQKLQLPSAPIQFIHYFSEDNRPQPKLDCNIENGMAISVGRLREDTQYDYKFVCLSHNTIRGAAGGAILLAELLAYQGFLD